MLSDKPNHRASGFVRWLAVVIAAVGTSPVQAEFTVGADLPAITLKTTEGTAVDIKRVDGVITVQFGDERMRPKAVVLHLLQPDCAQCRAQLRALKPLAARFRDRGVFTLGIAHRGTPEDARALAEDLKPGFPIALGVDTDIAKQFAAGDTLGIADATGVVRFAQVGFGDGDQRLWEQALNELVAGKQVTKAGVGRERLAVGDSMPVIKLPSLRDDKPMSLSVEDGRLVFQDETGKQSRPKAVVFFFSRYWAFSREEMVHLQKFHETYGKDGLQVFVIAMHPDREQAKRLTVQLGVTYPIFNGYGSDLGHQYAFG